MPIVLVPIAEGFEEIEAIALIDVMRRGGIEVIMGSLNDERLVAGVHNIVVQTDRPISAISADELDMIVLPGGSRGTKALMNDAKVQALLKEMDTKGKHIGAICAAPIALEAAGVLKEGYTCFPGIEEEINVGGYTGERHAVVESGNVMTSRGPGTAICFGLAIVKKLLGGEASERLKAGLLADHCV